MGGDEWLNDHPPILSLNSECNILIMIGELYMVGVPTQESKIIIDEK